MIDVCTQLLGYGDENAFVHVALQLHDVDL
jgi:hypothetical protein